MKWNQMETTLASPGASSGNTSKEKATRRVKKLKGLSSRSAAGALKARMGKGC